MIDLHQTRELRPLGRVLEIFNRAAERFVERSLIVGATARDLILHYANGSRIRRRTRDLDLAVSIGSWNAYAKIEQALLDLGAKRDGRMIHRFAIDEWKLDVIPFGAVERDGVIVWPHTETEMTVAGFDEASEHAEEVPCRTTFAGTSPRLRRSCF